MLNIQTQHKFKCSHQQVLFFKLLFNVKLIYSIQVLGPWLWGNWPFFSSVVGQRKGPSGENVPPVHGIKKCLGKKAQHQHWYNDPRRYDDYRATLFPK